MSDRNVRGPDACTEQVHVSNSSVLARLEVVHEQRYTPNIGTMKAILMFGALLWQSARCLGAADAQTAAVLYSTLLGHTNELANPMSIAIDAVGNAYVTGISIVTNTLAAPVPHVFVVKLDPKGTPIYGLLVAGDNGDIPGRIAVDGAGNAYVTGTTKSTTFPVTPNALQPELRGLSDAFVFKLDPTGHQIYSTYLGATRSSANPDSGDETGFAIAVDGTGAAYVTGATESAFFLRDLGALGLNHVQGSLNGVSDAFVAKLSPDGSHLLYATYLGGGGSEAGLGIALDSQTNICIIGTTTSTNFPTVNPSQKSYGGGASDVFVAKIDASGSQLLFATYLGGRGEEFSAAPTALSLGGGVAVDGTDNIYIAGDTLSSDFPVKNALQSTLRGASDGFVTKFSPQGAILYSTLLGGSNDDAALGIAVDTGGNAVLTGGTASDDFPTVNALSVARNPGDRSTFVTALNPTGSAILFSTYLSGGLNFGNGVTLDTTGGAFVTGTTLSTNFPNTGPPAAFLRTAFVTYISGVLPGPGNIPKAAQFTSFSFDANKAFHLGMTGQPGQLYLLEFSEDLKQWLLLAPLTASATGQFGYVDTRVGLFSRGFYRISTVANAGP
jgi:hypothetical protein